MGIKGKDRGLGDLLIGELVKAETLRRRADLFRLRAEDLEGRGSVRLGLKSAKKILAGLEKSKQASLSSLLFGLGIRYVGDRTAALLASHFRSLDAIAKATTKELEEVEEVGPNIAESIKRFFDSGTNKALIERLREYGLRFEQDEGSSRPVFRRFEGKVFVITGTLVGHDAGRGQVGDPAARGQGHRLCQRQDYVSAGGRESRLEAGQGTASECRRNR